MQRLALAVIVIAILVSLVAILTRGIALAVEERGGLSQLTTGGTMQKVAFFLLLALILYVSLNGAA